jgi:hypothetical protein
MHNSYEGAAVTSGLPGGRIGSYLLKGGDQSSSCLHCHQNSGDIQPTTFHVSTADGDMLPGTPPRQMPPGGDFAWLKKTYTWTSSSGTAVTSAGEKRGHSVVASDYNYFADGLRTVAPGGTYPSAALSCTSCHDPHGRFRRFADGTVASSGLPIFSSGSQSDSPDPTPGISAVGVYRLLGGQGYQPASIAGNYAFASPAPSAVAPATYNRAEDLSQTRVAYGMGMSEWCANCHTTMLQGGQTAEMKGLAHPVGNSARLSAGIIANYVAYVSTGNLTNTDASKAYLSLVPFEEGTTSYSLLKAHAQSDDSWLAGPESTAAVSCLTCHRAHASAFEGSLRFRAGDGFLTVPDGLGVASWPDPVLNPDEAQGRTAAETQAAYYGRPATRFAPFQRTLCNKCHAKD